MEIQGKITHGPRAIAHFFFGGLLRNAAAGFVVGGWIFFGFWEHFSKLANIQMSFNRPIERHFYDPKSAEVKHH